MSFSAGVFSRVLFRFFNIFCDFTDLQVNENKEGAPLLEVCLRPLLTHKVGLFATNINIIEKGSI